jgi:hypothetical protein
MIDLSGKRNSRKAYADAHRTHGVVQTALDSVWHWLNGVASGVAHFFGRDVVDAFHTVMAAIEVEVDAYQQFITKLWSIQYWVQIHVLKFLFNYFTKQLRQQVAFIRGQIAKVVRLIYVTTNQVLVTAMHAVRAERTQRIAAVAHAEALTRRDIRALHQTIEREAASAYQVDHATRVNLIVRLLEFAVTRNPELRDIVGVLIRGVLDLLSVDDPLVRLAIGFAIRDVIDKLGIDRLVGNLISRLLEPILGAPKPRNLHAVILDMGKRLVAAESFEATFTEDGGAQVEQAGRTWRDITQPAAAAAIVGFIALGVTEPNAWATVLNDTVGALGNGIIDSTATLVKGA